MKERLQSNIDLRVKICCTMNKVRVYSKIDELSRDELV